MSLLNKALKSIDEKNNKGRVQHGAAYPQFANTAFEMPHRAKQIVASVLGFLCFAALVGLILYFLPPRVGVKGVATHASTKNNMTMSQLPVIPAPAKTQVVQEQTQSASVSKPVPQQTIVQVSATPIQDVESLFSSATNNLQKDNVALAESQFKRVLALTPDMKKAREALLVLLLQKGSDLEALKIANDGLALSPNYIPFITLKARVLVQQGQINTAIDLLEQAAPSLDKHIDYYILLAGLYDNVSAYRKAAALYQSILDEAPNNAASWVGLGVALQSLGRTDEAIAVYRRALRINGLSPTLQGFIEKQISAG